MAGTKTIKLSVEDMLDRNRASLEPSREEWLPWVDAITAGYTPVSEIGGFLSPMSAGTAHKRKVARGEEERIKTRRPGDRQDQYAYRPVK
jgi:hypothetical protein